MLLVAPGRILKGLAEAARVLVSAGCSAWQAQRFWLTDGDSRAGAAFGARVGDSCCRRAFGADCILKTLHVAGTAQGARRRGRILVLLLGGGPTGKTRRMAEALCISSTGRFNLRGVRCDVLYMTGHDVT